MSAFSKPVVQWIEGTQTQGSAPVQEDCLEINPEKGIFILADGFGGSQGKLVARMAAQYVKQFLEQEAGDLDATLPFELRQYYSLAGNVLFNAISFANHKILQLNQGRNWLNSGGASLIAGYMDGKILAIANVGACTVYLKRDERIKELIQPKTLARQVNPFGDEQDGAQVPLMSVGTVKQLEPEIVEIEIRPKDQIVFQSSGLTNGVRDQLIQLQNPQEIRQFFEQNESEANASLIWVSL